MSTPPSVSQSALRVWLAAYRTEVTLAVISFVLLAGFSAQRFWRQSAAPHFVYQAQAWLEGRLDIDVQTLPNVEDWACVREVQGHKVRCEGQLQPGDKWYSSFPWFPAVTMLPWVAIHGYQFNDTSFGVLVAALAIALFYGVLRVLKNTEGTTTARIDDVVTALLLGFGTLFFYASLRGEVWFSAEVMGVACTALYLRQAIGARRPLLAGLCWSMAVLTRTPLFFTVLFFLLEVAAPEKHQRLKQLRDFATHLKARGKPLLLFILGAAPLGVAAAVYNLVRFGHLTEFGHRFFYNNRVNHDIDVYGLFHPHYVLRNLDAAFLKLPVLGQGPGVLGYDAWGLSLFITLPLLALCVTPAHHTKRAWQLVGTLAAVLVASAIFPPLPAPAGEPPIGFRLLALWLLLALALSFLVWSAWQWIQSDDAPRLAAPLLCTAMACVLPGLFYQNTGYAQFGFRFSLDYTPYFLLLIPLGGWSWKKPLPLLLAALSVAVNFWGAVAFRGYTEMVRGWL